MKVLISGFVAFGDYKENSSEILTYELDKNKDLFSFKLFTTLLPLLKVLKL